MTIPDSAIEAAEAAVRKYYSAGGWVRTADAAKLAVEAAYPLMEAQAKADALRDMERVLFDIESQHHIHGVECLCGFKSHRSRSRTEHITGLVRAATIEVSGS